MKLFASCGLLAKRMRILTNVNKRETPCLSKHTTSNNLLKLCIYIKREAYKRAEEKKTHFEVEIDFSLQIHHKTNHICLIDYFFIIILESA